MSNEKTKNPGCVGYIGNGKLPSYVGIIISSPYKDPQFKQPGFNGTFFFVAQVVFLLG